MLLGRCPLYLEESPAMRGPKPPTIDLAADERQELEQLVRRHTTPQQVALRARIVLAAADGANNCQIARHLDVSLDMVRRWRARWLGCQAAALEDLPVLDRLTDAPRPGTPPALPRSRSPKSWP